MRLSRSLLCISILAVILGGGCFSLKKDYSKFPDATIKLSELHSWQKDKERLKLYYELLNQNIKKDPVFANISLEEAKKSAEARGINWRKESRPYDYNRTMRTVDGFYYNASDANLPGVGLFILSSSPKIETMSTYWQMVYETNTQAIVTLFCVNETKGKSPPYWEDSLINRVSVPNGIGVQYNAAAYKELSRAPFTRIPTHVKKQYPEKARKALKISDFSPEQQLEYAPIVSIGEFVFTKDGHPSKNIVHLRYHNWSDACPVPDLDLLYDLLKEIRALKVQNPNDPILIHCKGGIGRTGLVFLSLQVMQEIDNQVKQGIALDDVKINVTELLYQTRKCRYKVVGKETQYIQAFEIAEMYYQDLKEQNSRKS